MRLLARLLLCTVTQAWTVNANVEKTIFLGPPAVVLSNDPTSLDTLALHVLSPANSTLPTRVHVEFPTESVPRGLESWYLLRGLDHGRRYEVRICWSATVSHMPYTSSLSQRASPDHAVATNRLLAGHLPRRPRARYAASQSLTRTLQWTRPRPSARRPERHRADRLQCARVPATASSPGSSFLLLDQSHSDAPPAPRTCRHQYVSV